MAQKTCFVIAPIGEAESETRKRSDQILKHVISPAVAECGYEPVRADQISEPGMITSQIIQHIVEDSLVIADLTDRNPNVFYELAIRHAIRKPLVQLIKKGEQIPFDVAGTRTIHVNHHDLDSAEEAKKEIISQIQSLEKDSSKLETPISVSLDLQILRQSDNPEQRSLADVLSVVTELRSSITSIEKRLEHSGPRLSSVDAAEHMELVELVERYEKSRHFVKIRLNNALSLLRQLMLQNDKLRIDKNIKSSKPEASQMEILLRIESILIELNENEIKTKRNLPSFFY